MNLATEKSKKQQIYQILEEEIMSSRLAPGTRLASRREMAERFECSDTVINEVCNLLEDRRMIVRKPKSGTFVNPQLKYGSSRLVVLILAMGTDNFENYIDSFLRESEAAGMLPMVCRVTPGNFVDSINRVRRRSPEKILLDLEGRLFPLELVKPLLKEIPHVFVNRWEWMEPPENAVITDEVAVYSKGLRFLMKKKGAKRILFIHSHKYPMPFRQKIMEGIERENGVTFGKDLIPFSFEEMNEEPASLKMKLKPGGIDAIFAVSDYYIVKMMELAAKSYPELLRLPKAGVYNMLYSRYPGKEFSTVPLNLEKMWKIALSMPENDSKPCFIEPAEIIVR